MSRDTSKHAAGHEAAAAHPPELETEANPEVARRASTAGLRAIQKKANAGPSTESVHAAAARGTSSPTTALPFADQIQASFGPAHDVSKIRAHVGGDSAAAMGANAYATGNDVVFDRAPDLHTAAHEAAHVVQQAKGVNLYGGVGEAGDSYEQHADAVADRVVAGQSAADLLGGGGGGGGAPAVQMDKKKISDASTDEQAKAHTEAERSSFTGMQGALNMLGIRIKQSWIRIGELSNEKKSKEDLRGPSVRIEQIRSEFEHVWNDARRVSSELGAEKPDASRGHLAPELKRAKGSFVVFKMTWEAAEKYAQSHGETLANKNPYWVEQIFESMTETLGYGPKELPPDTSVDERSDDAILTQDIKDNLGAAQLAVRSVRMGMATGKAAVLGQDFTRLIAHVREVKSVMEPLLDKKELALVKGFAKDVTVLAKDVAQLETEMDANPTFANTAKARQSELDGLIKAIKAKTGAR